MPPAAREQGKEGEGERAIRFVESGERDGGLVDDEATAWPSAISFFLSSGGPASFQKHEHEAVEVKAHRLEPFAGALSPFFFFSCWALLRKTTKAWSGLAGPDMGKMAAW